MWSAGRALRRRRLSKSHRGFRFAPRYLLAGLPFGITPWTARVQVDAGVLAVRFGYWRLRTPVTNIVGTVVTGPFGFLRTGGPARLSLADVGLTFATNGERGLCIRFAQPVRGGLNLRGLLALHPVDLASPGHGVVAHLEVDGMKHPHPADQPARRGQPLISRRDPLDIGATARRGRPHPWSPVGHAAAGHASEGYGLALAPDRAVARCGRVAAHVI